MRRVRFLLIIVTTIVLLLMALPAYAAPAATTSAGHAGSSGCVQWYRVQCGDTLSKIAAHFGTSVWALAQYNGICNPNVIYAGQTICVRWGAAPPPPPPHGGGFWYTVQRGDMLRIIAARYGWGTWDLARVNHIPNPDVIYAGQKLWIPYH